MRRSLSIFIWILLGAFSSGVSLGYFLHRSNSERLELVSVAQAAQRELSETQSASAKLVEEANQKIAQVQKELDKKQAQVQRLQEEQTWLRQAEPLTRPQSYYRTWQERVSVPLRFSIRVPAKHESWDDDMTFGIGSGRLNSDQGVEQWLSISPYDESKFQSMLKQISDAKSVYFLVNKTLLVGQHGTFPSLNGTVYLLRDSTNGTSTRLLWARTNREVNEQKILDTLASLTFGE